MLMHPVSSGAISTSTSASIVPAFPVVVPTVVFGSTRVSVVSVDSSVVLPVLRFPPLVSVGRYTYGTYHGMVAFVT